MSNSTGVYPELSLSLTIKNKDLKTEGQESNISRKRDAYLSPNLDAVPESHVNDDLNKVGVCQSLYHKDRKSLKNPT